MAGRATRIITIAGGAAALAATIAAAVFILGDVGGAPPVFVEGARSLARVERDHPLTAEHRAAMTSESLTALSAEARDQVYARIAAGAAPDGFYRAVLAGDAVAALTGPGRRLPGETADFVRQVAALAWSGRQIDAERGVAVSVSDDFGPVQVLINRISAIEGVPPDYRNFPVSEVPRDGILSLVLSTTSAYAMFPARLTCGASLADPRRESHVLDHRRNDGIEGYRPIPDVVTGGRGLALREEYRMVRPGLYLGKAYASGVPLGHVILSQDDAAEGTADEGSCWSGEPSLAAR